MWKKFLDQVHLLPGVSLEQQEEKQTVYVFFIPHFVAHVFLLGLLSSNK